jgi:hypothetical protein
MRIEEEKKLPRVVPRGPEGHARTLGRALRVGLGAAAIAALVLAPRPSAAADRQSGVQMSQSGFYVLVSKDVGSDRWAITADSDGEVVGNVFPQDGGAPQFVDCFVNDQDTTDTDYAFDCSVASSCGDACNDSDWQSVGEVMLAKSFLTPPGGDAPFSLGAAAAKR